MRKGLGFIVLVSCVTLYVISMNQDLTKKFTAYKIDHNGPIRSDRYRYGDLYGMSYLPYFRKQFQEDTMVKFADCNYKNNVNLVAITDSYVWPIFTSSKFYCGVNKLTYIESFTEGFINSKLDPSKINVLLLEFSERNISFLLNDQIFGGTLIDVPDTNVPGKLAGNPQNKKDTTSGFFNSIASARTAVFGILFNKRINNTSNRTFGIFHFSRLLRS